MDIQINLTEKTAQWPGHTSVPIVYGRDGAIDLLHKQEGDMKTPLGRYAITHVFYRPDRLQKPRSVLPMIDITPELGWCDDSNHPAYNTLVKLPFSASHEKLFRDDHSYDLGIVIAYNTINPVPGKGSAIFGHIMPKSGYTAGCIGFLEKDLRILVQTLTPNTHIIMRE